MPWCRKILEGPPLCRLHKNRPPPSAAFKAIVPAPAPQKPSEPSKPAPQKPSPVPPTVPEKKPEQPKPSSPACRVGAGEKTGAAETRGAEEAAGAVKTGTRRPRENQRPHFKGGTATGLVIDGRGLGLRPALLPKIVDPQGQEIYVGQVVTRTNAVEQGVAGYAKDVNAAANNFRVTDNPAVIKGLRASGAARTDVVVGQSDAQMLRQLGSRGDFLQYCRVIIVY